MQLKSKLDDQAKAVALATGAGAVAAIGAMFVPTGIWETLTGSTGISEMVPATAPPLGDTARALISYSLGALTLLLLSGLFLRKAAHRHYPAIAHDDPFWSYSEAFEDNDTVEDAEAFVEYEMFDGNDAFDEAGDEKASIFARLRARIAAFVEARRNGGEITDLEDLPKLRSGDAHPDAPPRRPFSANRDILEAEGQAVDASEAVVSVETVEAEWVEPIEVEATEFEPENEAQLAAPAFAATASTTSQSVGISSLDDMVSRFESALAERDAQLAYIEKIASELPVSNVQPIRPDIAPAAAYEPAPVEPTPLRAVVRDEDMPVDVPQRPESEELDAALRSALETLHRMNARTR
jgi:hypothetical protein